MAECWATYLNWLKTSQTLDWLLTEMSMDCWCHLKGVSTKVSMECWLSIDWVLIDGHSRVSVVGIDRHCTTDQCLKCTWSSFRHLSGYVDKKPYIFSQFFTESKQQSKFESLTISTVTNIQTGKDLIMYLVFVVNNYISYSNRLSSTWSTKDHILHLIIVLVLYKHSFCFIW